MFILTIIQYKNNDNLLKQQVAQAVKHRIKRRCCNVAKIQFKVKHIIIKTSKEQKEIHMKQVFAALIKIAEGETKPNAPQQF